MGTALEAPAWPPITLAQAEQVLARLPEAGQLLRLEWHSPRPFSAAALAQAEHGTVFLKRHHRAMRSVAGLGAEHAFMRHLADRGQPVLRPLADVAGHTVLAAGDWVHERNSNILDGGAHFYRCYKTSDGKFVSIASIEAKFYAILLDKLGLDPADRRPSHKWRYRSRHRSECVRAVALQAKVKHPEHWSSAPNISMSTFRM